MDPLHDATLRTIEVDWPSRSVVVSLTTSRGAVALSAIGVSLIHAPRIEPWGPSASVLGVVGPADTGAGVARLVIEMQSGDAVTIEAAEFTGPTHT